MGLAAVYKALVDGGDWLVVAHKIGIGKEEAQLGAFVNFISFF